MWLSGPGMGSGSSGTSYGAFLTGLQGLRGQPAQSKSRSRLGTPTTRGAGSEPGAITNATAASELPAAVAVELALCPSRCARRGARAFELRRGDDRVGIGLASRARARRTAQRGGIRARRAGAPVTRTDAATGGSRLIDRGISRTAADHRPGRPPARKIAGITVGARRRTGRVVRRRRSGYASAAARTAACGRPAGGRSAAGCSACAAAACSTTR